jgi:hypothetical protein
MKGIFINLTSNYSAIVFDTANISSKNGHICINCSFENLKSTGECPGSIGIFDANTKYNITNCFFFNISNDYNNPRAGGVNCEMNNNNNNGYYNVSRNTFVEIKTNKSVMIIIGSFSSVIFTYNSFYNVSSTGSGGVLKF